MFKPIYVCVSTTEVSLCRVDVFAAYDFPGFPGHVEAYTSLLVKFPTCSALFPSGRWKLQEFCCRKPARGVCLTKCSATHARVLQQKTESWASWCVFRTILTPCFKCSSPSGDKLCKFRHGRSQLKEKCSCLLFSWNYVHNLPHRGVWHAVGARWRKAEAGTTIVSPGRAQLKFRALNVIFNL